jgi:hypothetical protein
MQGNQKSDGEMEKLSRAITQALLKSDDVLNILTLLKKNDRLKSDALIAFVLKANDLLHISKKEEIFQKSNANAFPAGLLNPAKISNEEIFIDGKKLSEQEIAFEEYCSTKFNEKKWLRDLGIQF